MKKKLQAAIILILAAGLTGVGSALAQITMTQPPPAAIGVPYSYQIVASGGNGNYTFQVLGSLPAGITLSSTGLLHGTPTAAGSASIEVTDSAQTSMVFTVAAPAPPTSTRYYASTSFWNTPVPSTATPDPNSATLIKTSITPYISGANFTNSPTWGIAVTIASSSSPTMTVKCVLYGCSNTVTAQVPPGALASSGSDHSLRILMPYTNPPTEMDGWDCTVSSTAISCGSRYINQLDGWGATCARGQHCNGPVAAGFAGMGGLVRPEEIQAGHIDHALIMALPKTRAGCFVGPATHTDGNTSGTSAAPEGALIRIPASFVIPSTWPAWKK